MIRRVFSALPKGLTSCLLSRSCQNSSQFIKNSITSQQNANFTSVVIGTVKSNIFPKQFHINFTKLLVPKVIAKDQIRTVTKFSLQKGKRKTVSTVTNRFFRLHWGIWIRRMAGHSRLYAKKKARRHRLLSHMFCNATQSHMLDKMVNHFWRKPKYYIDDAYGVYHQRDNFYFTRKKPWRPEGVDYE